MHSTRKVLWAVVFVMPLLLGSSVLGFETDDEIPDVTARVARISFLRGDVQIRRLGSQDWERAVLNLPIVEGDEITTDAAGRFEIQFNSYTHVRVAESSYLKITGLKDEGIALSLAEGTLSLRLSAFDKDRSFFEIDAPKTTIAMQKAGMYRVDAGKPGEEQVRVSVTDHGEARVYSDNSGFTLKNGRTARIYIEGNYSGEWETADASRFADEFDEWSLERDATIAKRLRDAHYDKYYDRDIYGAEDLSEYGDWVHTRKYGYVWRPYRNSISRYANWSPYRYGHWRWVPPYGWTWVNDEPWGWATYHHGRWVYDNGGWYWTPYGYYRHRRSWWLPALVGVIVHNNNICWYPLPYNYGYYNYNYYYGNHYGGRRHNRWGGNNNSGGNNTPLNPVPTPTPAVVAPQIGPNAFANNDQRRAWFQTPPLLRVPPSGVISTSLSTFGRDRKGFDTAPPSVAKVVLSKALAQQDPIRMLPTYAELNGKVSLEIRPEKPRSLVAGINTQTGATERKSDGPIDEELRAKRIFGDRLPIQTKSDTGEQNTVNTGVPERRKTGAVVRPIIQQPEQGDEPIRPAPTYTQRSKPRDVEPVRAEPTYTQPSKPREDRQSEPVKQPRYEAPQKPREEPRDDPPPRSEPPPRNDPPPRNEPAPRSDPPPSKTEPSKPDPPADRKSKDGR